MIRAEFYMDRHQHLYGYCVDGHAGFGEEGYDIICAAVSSLALNTANSIEVLAHQAVETEVHDGHLLVIVPSIKDGKECREAELLIASLRLGLESIRDSYGSKYLTLSNNQN